MLKTRNGSSGRTRTYNPSVNRGNQVSTAYIGSPQHTIISISSHFPDPTFMLSTFSGMNMRGPTMSRNGAGSATARTHGTCRSETVNNAFGR